MHLAAFPFKVVLVILYDAERIYPEIAISQPTNDMHGINKGLRQALHADVLKPLRDVDCRCLGDRFASLGTPAVAQRKVVRLGKEIGRQNHAGMLPRSWIAYVDQPGGKKLCIVAAGSANIMFLETCAEPVLG